MKIQGCDCSIVIRTKHIELDVPYSEETIREAVSLLQEEAAIEGNGNCKAVVKKNGVTGCVVTPLTIGTAPLLLYLAMGSVDKPVFISETRNLYRYQLDLLPMENSDCFDLIQDRGIERFVFEQCRVQGFELRFEREKPIKLKLDVCGERSGIPLCGIPLSFASQNSCNLSQQDFIEIQKEKGEIFNSNNVTYKINDRDYSNIYGLTIIAKKEGGSKTEIWIKRTISKDSELPNNIEKIVITATLIRDKYEHCPASQYSHFGIFRKTLNNLVLVSDETSVNSSDTVIGPLRYYVSGSVYTEVFTTGEGAL